jgi:hypothetical protein
MQVLTYTHVIVLGLLSPSHFPLPSREGIFKTVSPWWERVG